MGVSESGNGRKYKLRYLDVVPCEVGNQNLFMVRDPLMYSDETISVNELGYVVISCMNGRNSVKDIVNYLKNNFNLEVAENQVEEVAQAFDDIYFLDNERFHKHKEKVESDFKKTKVREHMYFGLSYPRTPQKIVEMFDSFFDGNFGNDNGNVIQGIDAMIVPHIDFRIGGRIYADAYREIIPILGRYERFIIFGTSHYGSENLFSLTEKDFNTSLGKVETDKNIVRKINSELSYDGYANESVHRIEHSIEFQTIFLKYLQDKYNRTGKFKIVPVLFDSFMFLARQGKKPEDIPDFEKFVKTIKQIKDEKTCIIASVDLSHVGKKFGDPEGLDKGFIEYVQNEDARMMESIKNSNSKAFWDSVIKENDKLKVCGFSPIYTLLKILGSKSAKVVSYDKNFDESTQSMVSYASLVY